MSHKIWPVGLAVTLITSTFLMGSSFVAGKILLQAGVPAILLVGWRFLVASIATLPFLFNESRNTETFKTSDMSAARTVLLVSTIGLLQTTAVMGLLFMAMQTITAASAAILLFTNPIWVAFLAWLIFKERLLISNIMGLILGLGGVVLAIGYQPGMIEADGAVWGDLIGLGSAICWSVATLINKYSGLRVKPWTLSFWQMFIGSLALLLIAYINGESWPPISIENWFWFFWLAIPASTGSFGLWFVALQRGGATKTSGFLFMAPVFTVILSYLVLATPLLLQQLAGGILIVVALWLVNRKSN